MTTPRSIFGVTVHQPWPWALAHPEKFAIPCRTLPRAFNAFAARVHGLQVHRGCLLAIHASEQWDEDAARWIVEHTDTHVPLAQTIDRGAVVAVAELVTTSRAARDVPRPEGGAVRDPWARTGALWYWYVRNVVPVEPVPCAGATGLWSLDVDVHARLRPAYAEGVRAMRARLGAVAA